MSESPRFKQKRLEAQVLRHRLLAGGAHARYIFDQRNHLDLGPADLEQLNDPRDFEEELALLSLQTLAVCVQT